MIKKILLLLIVPASVSYAQLVYEPIHSGVYDFLDLMAQKGIIQFYDEIKPVSRAYIAEKILEVKETGDRKPETGTETEDRRQENGGKLTDLEKEELDFYLKDFRGCSES